MSGYIISMLRVIVKSNEKSNVGGFSVIKLF